MKIEYKDTQVFTPEQLRELFLSVNWSSGHYPEKLAVSMKNSDAVFSAWDGGRLVGLTNVLDDGIMTAYVHYLLVHPDYQGKGAGKELIRMVAEKYKDYLRIVLVADNEKIGFYENSGFKLGEKASPMFITSLWT